MIVRWETKNAED